jgi:hypothetical protein
MKLFVNHKKVTQPFNISYTSTREVPLFGVNAASTDGRQTNTTDFEIRRFYPRWQGFHENDSVHFKTDGRANKKYRHDFSLRDVRFWRWRGWLMAVLWGTGPRNLATLTTLHGATSKKTTMFTTSLVSLILLVLLLIKLYSNVIQIPMCDEGKTHPEQRSKTSHFPSAKKSN